MKFSTFLILSSYAGASLAQTHSRSFSKKSRSTNVVPNEFIVEFDDARNSPSKRAFQRPHDAVYEALRVRGIPFASTDEYHSPGIFTGAAVTLDNADDSAALASTPGVKAVRPVVHYDRPELIIESVVSDPADPVVPVNAASTHVMTGVDKLHADGVLGSGITIGIIDTGIDYTHPLLGGGFGREYKVIGGYDFVGDLYNGTNTPVADPDPLDKCYGHGTHVAGIIGANPDNPFNITGVAYKASLNAYRVFGCNGTVTDRVIIKALLRAVQDGNDILTLSLGSESGWTEGSASVVASRIAASGKIVTVAAANSGMVGAWYTSGPANGIHAISVASVDNTEYPVQSFLVQGVQHDPMIYSTFSPIATGTFPIYAISSNISVTADACKPLPDGTPNLSKYVTLVRRGTCTFVEKLQNVAKRGAKIVLFYDNGRGFAGIKIGNFTSAAHIQAADGEFLVKQFLAGVDVRLVFPKGGRLGVYHDPHGGLVSSFSSYGPTNDLYFKPAFAAPGGSILSTIPTNLGTYGVESGTSMSTPFAAGSAALLLSVKGKSKEVTSHARTLFQTTARVIPSSKQVGSSLQTVAQQGAGLINVYNAIHSTTWISRGEMLLNDTANFNPLQDFTVKNNGKNPRSYKLRHIPAGTALTVQKGKIFPSLGPVPLSTASLRAFISPDHFDLQPGESQTIRTIFFGQYDDDQYPVFSGFIEVAGASESDTYHVSYLGLGASLRKKQVLDDTDVFFGYQLPALLNATGDAQTTLTNYTFVNKDVPTLQARLVFGTPLVRIDLVEPDVQFSPTILPRQLSNTSFPNPSHPNTHKDGTFSRVNVLGPLAEFHYVSRNDEEVDLNGFYTFSLEKPVFTNNARIPNGCYRMLLRALRVTGDPDKEEDYESWLSPIFVINASDS